VKEVVSSGLNAIDNILGLNKLRHMRRNDRLRRLDFMRSCLLSVNGSDGTDHNTDDPVPLPRALDHSNAVPNGRIFAIDHMDGSNCHGCIFAHVQATNAAETDRP
jgi:hypothetical protein